METVDNKLNEELKRISGISGISGLSAMSGMSNLSNFTLESNNIAIQQPITTAAREDSPLTLLTATTDTIGCGINVIPDTLNSLNNNTGMASPPRLVTSNITMSSVLRRTIESKRRTSDWFMSTTSHTKDDNKIDESCKDLPKSPVRVSRTQDLLFEIENLHNIVSDDHHELPLENVEQKTDLVPLKLFELSLESPKISSFNTTGNMTRPSIEMPPTFSKAPSVKRKGITNLISSQDSIFVAATQFPTLLPIQDQHQENDFINDQRLYDANEEDINKATSSNVSMEIPATQYPLRKLDVPRYIIDFDEDIATEADILAPCSPTLFDTNTDITEKAEYSYSGHEAVILPPSDSYEKELNENEGVNENVLIEQDPSFLSGNTVRSVKNSQNPFQVPPPTTIGKRRRVQFYQDCEQGLLKSISKKSGRRTLIEVPLSSSKVDGTPIRTLFRIPTTPSQSIDDAIWIPATSSSQKLTPATVTDNNEIVTETTADVVMDAPPPLPVRKKRQISNQQERQQQQSVGPIKTQLNSHMLVWARWRPPYYSPAIIRERMSRTRDLWAVRFCHWRGHRLLTLPIDDICLSDMPSLVVGDNVLVVRNRKRLVMDLAVFVGWLGVGQVIVRVEGGGEETLDISRIVIDRSLFKQIKTDRQSSLLTSLPSAPSVASGLSVASSQLQLNNQNEQKKDIEASYTTKLRLPKTKGKGKTRHFLKDYSFWISLGSLSPSVKRIQKSQIVTRLRSLGGSYLGDDISQVSGCGGKHCILLSNGFCRTPKMMFAVINNLPIVRLDWLEACEKSRELVSKPAFAVHIPRRSEPLIGSLKRIFDGITFALEGHDKFQASWTGVCSAAGANIVPTYTKLDISKQGRILVEKLPSSTNRLSRFASTNSNIEIVTIDWLIDCLLNSCIK